MLTRARAERGVMPAIYKRSRYRGLLGLANDFSEVAVESFAAESALGLAFIADVLALVSSPWRRHGPAAGGPFGCGHRPAPRRVSGPAQPSLRLPPARLRILPAARQSAPPWLAACAPARGPCPRSPARGRAPGLLPAPPFPPAHCR